MSFDITIRFHNNKVSKIFKNTRKFLKYTKRYKKIQKDTKFIQKTLTCKLNPEIRQDRVMYSMQKSAIECKQNATYTYNSIMIDNL